MNRRVVLVVTAAASLAACGFSPNRARGGDGGVTPGSDAQAGPDAASIDSLLPVDALPLIPDAPPGSCRASWRSGTVPQFTTGSMFISNEGSIQRDPELDPSETKLYFSSNRGSAILQIWEVDRGAGGFPVDGEALSTNFTAVNALGGDIDKVTFSSAAPDIIFSSDHSGNQLWNSHDAGSGLGTPDQTGLEAVNVAGQALADPQLSSDDQHLYYVTDTGGTQHIVMATRTPAGAWSAGVPYHSLDSGQGDADPSLSPDESVIVFSSQRTGGAGLTDLYYAVRDSAGGEFGPVQALASINTASHEGDPVLTKSGCSIIFATDQDEDDGDYDIWLATMVGATP